MRKQRGHKPGTGWLGRLLRGLRPGRNPLRRGSDRAETAVLAALLAAAGWLTRRSLDRRRLAGWDAEWLANGPRWSPRRLGPDGRD